MKTKKITALMLSLLLALSLYACSKDSEETTVVTTTTTTTEATTTTTEATTTTTEETTEPSLDTSDPLYNPNINLAVNPINGLQDMDKQYVGKRSVAVVVNNCHAAIPQRGISQADAIYEYETEGGQTRLLCLFADVNDIPEIGSLRSARIIASDLAAGTNTIFIHYGRNARVPDHISQWGIDHIDGNNCSAGRKDSKTAENGYVDLPDGLFFWRDSTWLDQRALEHTAVTDGVHILEGIEHFGIELKGDTPMLFNYVPDNSTDIEAGETCTEINVYFSSTNDDALFVYDPATKLYAKSQYGGTDQIDETNGEQIKVTNIFVLFANIQGHGDGTIDAYLEDGGAGYYISNGKLINITWTKPTPNDQIKVFNEAGKEVEVNRGITYICMVDNDKTDKTTWS